MGNNKSVTNKEQATEWLRDRLAGFPKEGWSPVTEDINPEDGNDDLVEWVQVNDRETFSRVKARFRKMEPIWRDQFTTVTHLSRKLIEQIAGCSNDDEPRTAVHQKFVRAVLDARNKWIREARDLS